MRKIVIGVAAVLVVIGVLYEIADYSMQSSTEFKSAHIGSGTVVSVSKGIPHVTSGTLSPQGKDVVCITLDDWGKVRDDPQYETAEREREQTAGPRCLEFDNLPVIAKLKSGDKIQVVYLLENNFHIDIARINAYGVDLVPR